MLTQIKGLHHVTSMAAHAQENNDFFTKLLGLRRVKKTVNFDAPDVYHLYYGDAVGSPGTVMTSFPFPHIAKGGRGVGEVSRLAFSVSKGAIDYWKDRLHTHRVAGVQEQKSFGERRLGFLGPDGENLVLVEVDGDRRAPFADGPVPAAEGIHGFCGVTMTLRDQVATAELLNYMGYQKVDLQGAVTRYALNNGNGADLIDLEVQHDAPNASPGAGSVHHVAFAVEDRAAQLEVRKALVDTGYHVTPVIDRDYFWSIYFRTPGGVLFEVATNEPGFDRDEDRTQLGHALKIPVQHAHLRRQIEQSLPPIAD